MMTSPIPGGFLIALEGIDGAGKTTQAHMLESYCHVRQLDCVRSKEPTNGKFGWILRRAAKTGRLPVAEELNICIQDRAEHVEAVIRPALAQNQIVILDRHYFSNAAYQGARGTSPKSILQMNESFAPHLLVILDHSAIPGLLRAYGKAAASPTCLRHPSRLDGRVQFSTC
jgi:dTMP kinase